MERDRPGFRALAADPKVRHASVLSWSAPEARRTPISRAQSPDTRYGPGPPSSKCRPPDAGNLPHMPGRYARHQLAGLGAVAGLRYGGS